MDPIRETLISEHIRETPNGGTLISEFIGWTYLSLKELSLKELSLKELSLEEHHLEGLSLKELRSLNSLEELNFY